MFLSEACETSQSAHRIHKLSNKFSGRKVLHFFVFFQEPSQEDLDFLDDSSDDSENSEEEVQKATKKKRRVSVTKKRLSLVRAAPKLKRKSIEHKIIVKRAAADDVTSSRVPKKKFFEV